MTADRELYGEEHYELVEDRRQVEAREVLRRVFDEHRDEVFFFRQLEVRHERVFFHWVTNRALKDLIDAREVESEERELVHGGRVRLVWHRRNRYYRRRARQVVRLIEEYSDPNIGAALGLHGEMMALEGFARSGFLMKGREVKGFGGREWVETGHDVDFVFERDGVAYGVEVKNTLGYIDREELGIKRRLCAAVGLRPLFVVRAMPKSWINEVVLEGGLVLVLGYQLYPWTHRELARRVAEELGLPVDAPRALYDRTTIRLLRMHGRYVGV